MDKVSYHRTMRVQARKQWDSACWDVRGAELRYGVGSDEWLAACQREKAAQDAYAQAAAKERQTSPW
jgi:hypothetical protein